MMQPEIASRFRAIDFANISSGLFIDSLSDCAFSCCPALAFLCILRDFARSRKGAMQQCRSTRWSAKTLRPTAHKTLSPFRPLAMLPNHLWGTCHTTDTVTAMGCTCCELSADTLFAVHKLALVELWYLWQTTPSTRDAPCCRNGQDQPFRECFLANLDL